MGTINSIGTPTITLGGAYTMSGAYTFTGTLTNTTAVTFPTSGTLATTGQVYLPVAASASTQACVANTIYYVTYASTCALTLPSAPALGTVVGVVGEGAGGWTLAPNTSQAIKLLGVSASTSVASAEAFDCIFVMYVATNVWVAYSFVTTGFTYS